MSYSFFTGGERVTQSQIFLKFTKYLQEFFPVYDLSEWIAKNLLHLTIPILKFAEKLCSIYLEV